MADDPILTTMLRAEAMTPRVSLTVLLGSEFVVVGCESAADLLRVATFGRADAIGLVEA